VDGSFKQVAEAALRLSEDERAELIQQLDASLHRWDDEGEIEKATVAEAKRRLADLQAGKTRAIPWDEAKAQLLERLSKCR
jgi:putative addiction module component (TIGR02574 family)